MNQKIACWLFAGCVAATFLVDRPMLGQDTTELRPALTLETAADTIRLTLEKIEPFPPAVLESQLVGVQFSFLSVDAAAADAVFFAEQKEFQQLVKRVSPASQLRIEESQLAHGWNRVVRSSLIPELLAEIIRRQPEPGMSVVSEQHVTATLGRQFNISLDNSPNSSAEIVEEPLSGFDWLQRIRLTPVLESSNRLSLTAHFVIQPGSDDADGVIEARVRTARVLLHEDQSVVALLRGSDDNERALLVVMTPGRARSIADELAGKQEPDFAIAFAAAELSDAQVDAQEQAEVTPPTQQPAAPSDAPREDAAPATDAQLLKEIRELRTLIQGVRGDVLRLRYELRLQEPNSASHDETTETEGLQSATEVIRVPASQSRLFDRGRAVHRIALADPSIVDVTQYTPEQFGISGLKPGTTTISVWFDGAEKPLMLTVQIDGPGKPVDVLLTPQQTKAHHDIETALDQPVQLEFENVPLTEVLRAIKDLTRINVIVDAVALEEEGFTTQTERTIHVENVTLRSALNILLDDIDLGWVIENETLRITSKTRLKGRLIAQAYHVPELAGFEDDREQRLERLIELITETVAPDTWQQVGGRGTIQAFPRGNSLVVRQTEDVHVQIKTLLQSLSRLLTAQNQPVESHLGAPESSRNSSRSIEWVDRLETVRQPNGLKRPMVVVDAPPLELYRPGQRSGLTLRGRIGPPMEVGSGKEKRATESGLPRVTINRGIYVNQSRSTINSITREYTPSRTLLTTFRKDGESDSTAAKKLVEHIQQAVKPGPWNTDDAQIEVYVGGTVRLVIRHTPGTHDRIRRLLERMEAEAKAEQSGKPLNNGEASIDGSADKDLAWTGPADDVPVNLAAIWNQLGLKPGPALVDVSGKPTGKYRGGLTVADVRKDSPLAAAYVRKGDILVGIHKWEILSSENVDFVLKQIDEGLVPSPFSISIVRDGQSMVGEAPLPDRQN